MVIDYSIEISRRSCWAVEKLLFADVVAFTGVHSKTTYWINVIFYIAQMHRKHVILIASPICVKYHTLTMSNSDHEFSLGKTYLSNWYLFMTKLPDTGWV